jgi:hypothetical protein
MKRKHVRRIAHIIKRNRRCMGLQRNIGFFGLLCAFEVSGLSLRNLLYRGPGSLGATAGSAGSSVAAGEVGGAAVASVGGSSSSLH